MEQGKSKEAEEVGGNDADVEVEGNEAEVEEGNELEEEEGNDDGGGGVALEQQFEGDVLA